MTTETKPTRDEILAMFVSGVLRESSNQSLRSSFAIGEWTYATDGVAMVRVKREAGDQGINERQPISAPEIFKAAQMDRQQWTPLPPTTTDFDQPLLIKGQPFATAQLQRLAELPGIEVSISRREPLDPLPFRFEGGEGLLMPLNPQLDTKGMETLL